MADMKNNQSHTAGLPEKEWFTLEEVADRWGCAVHDLLHYGTNKKLTLCFRPGCRPIHYILSPCTILDDGWPEEAIDGKDVFIDNSEKWNGINRFLSNWSLVCIPAPHLFHISKYGEWKGEIKRIDCIFDHSFKPEFNNLILRRREAFHVPESSHAYTVRARFGSNKDSPAPELSISLPDILVPKEERDRFEREYRIGAYAGTMPDLSKPDTQPTYTTTYIDIMHAAINEFFEPRRSVDARKDEVVEWIKVKLSEAGLLESDNVATAMFTIIKPSNHDPKKRRGSTPQSPS